MSTFSEGKIENQLYAYGSKLQVVKPLAAKIGGIRVLMHHKVHRAVIHPLYTSQSHGLATQTITPIEADGNAPKVVPNWKVLFIKSLSRK